MRELEVRSLKLEIRGGLMVRGFLITALMLACLILMSAPSFALEHLKPYISHAEKVGEGRLKVFFTNVYDAELYATKAVYKEDAPFAIHITYLRNIPKVKIADRSIDEIAGQGIEDDAILEGWRTEMLRVFPDVKKGTTLTGIYTADGTAMFYKDGKPSGEIKDKAFAKSFFDIWMREDTSSPDLRRKLLGIAK